MNAVVFDRHGDPAEVLHVADRPTPEPRFGQVRVRMRASPMNPSDLLTVEGRYGKLPKLPASPGYEGVGVVEKNGGGVIGRLRRGKRVAVLSAEGGTWAEQVVVPARQVFPVPDEVPDEQAATFFVNPITALVMTRYELKVPAGAWLLQSAAGSALGKMVIRLGKMHGFRTINVVRRREQADELKRAGADEVISTDTESIEERVRAITQGQGVPFALDPVGGETGSAVVRTLAPGGRAVLYGLLSGDSVAVDPRFLITGSKKVEGFWLVDWMRKQNVLTLLRVFRRVRRLMQEGVLTSDFAATYPLEQIRDAAKHVQSAARGGKILLRIGG